MTSRPRKRVAAICEQCQGVYQRRSDAITQRFCSLKCKGAAHHAQPKTWKGTTFRRLLDHEPVPAGEPKRYRNGSGYIVLRWKIGVASYVEAFEHRIVTGRISQHVHHINGIKDDNRLENLRPVTSIEHGTEHTTWDVTEACELYLAGWSLPRLSKRFSKDHAHIMRALKRRGVVMRTLSEAWQVRRQIA
jgi:hypothetical protein